MAGDTIITIVGNLTADPEMRFTPSGAAVASFTVASTPRTFDRAAGEWKDGETLFMRCSIWRDAAENVAESLTKGTRVIVQGRLVQRSYTTREGENRTVVEMQVDEIGPSLRYAKAQVTRQPRGGGVGLGGSQGRVSVEGLALQVAFLHDVVVDDDQPPHPGGSQVLQHGSTEAARPDAAHRGCLEPALGLLPETVDGHGSLVAFTFGFGEGLGDGDDRLHQLSGSASRMTRASSPGSRSGWVAIANPHR